MNESQKSLGVSSNRRDAYSDAELSQRLLKNEEPPVLDEYVKPSDLAGTFSPPITLLTILAASFMFGITALTIVDVTGRYVFNSPIRGGVELIEFMLGLLIFSSLPLVSVKRAHITVELFDNFMSSNFKRYREVIVLITSAIMIGFITERMFSTGIDAYEADDISMHLDLPMAPIIFVLTILSATSVIIQGYMVWKYISSDFHKKNDADSMI